MLAYEESALSGAFPTEGQDADAVCRSFPAKGLDEIKAEDDLFWVSCHTHRRHTQTHLDHNTEPTEFLGCKEANDLCLDKSMSSTRHLSNDVARLLALG